MPHHTPLNVIGAMFLLIFALLTAFWPLRSVTLFTLLAPFADYEWLGWDFRLYWGLMLGARAFWDRLYGPKRSGLISGKAILCWFVLCVAATCVLYVNSSDLTPEDVFEALSILGYFVIGCLYLFAVIQFVTTEQQVKPVLYCLASAALAVSLYAVWESIVSSAARAVATLGNPNYLATNLALASTSLLLLAGRQRNWSRLAFFACAVVALLGTIVTFSRAGVASALTGWMLVYVTRIGRIEYRKVALIVALVALIAGAGAGGYLFEYRQEATFAGYSKHEDLADATQAAEDLSRLEAALYAVQLIGEHPILGLGLGTFAARNYHANGFYVTTHNTWLQLLAGTGAVGTILLGALVWSMAHGLRKAGRILYLPVAGCFLVSSLFGDYLQSIDVIVILSVMYVFSWHQSGADFVSARKAVEG